MVGEQTLGMAVGMCFLWLRFVSNKNKIPFPVLLKDFVCLLRKRVSKNILLVVFKSYYFKIQYRRILPHWYFKIKLVFMIKIPEVPQEKNCWLDYETFISVLRRLLMEEFVFCKVKCVIVHLPVLQNLHSPTPLHHGCFIEYGLEHRRNNEDKRYKIFCGKKDVREPRKTNGN